VQEVNMDHLPEPEDFNAVLLQMLGHPNLRSRRSIFTQYDHQVGTDTVVLPGADAAVIRIKGTNLGFAVTTDGRGRHCFLGPRGGGAATVAEAYRNLSCVGAEPVAVTDCLNFGSPEKPDGYYQLAECIGGMSEACEVLGTPVVSGNVSLYNETDRGAIYPTPTVGMVGVMKDVNHHATPAFKREGDRVMIVGGVKNGPSFAGSEYLEVVHGEVAGQIPEPDVVEEKAYSDLIRILVERGLVDTVHDISGGGEIIALAEMAIAGGVGFAYDESELERYLKHTRRPDLAFFGESGASFLIAFPEERWEEVEDALGATDSAGVNWVAYDDVGRTDGNRFKVGDLIDLDLDELRSAYERDLFEADAPEGGHIG
jgi:phosphoribosylformylglycinamidine synthase subunit PurL